MNLTLKDVHNLKNVIIPIRELTVNQNWKTLNEKTIAFSKT